MGPPCTPLNVDKQSYKESGDVTNSRENYINLAYIMYERVTLGDTYRTHCTCRNLKLDASLKIKHVKLILLNSVSLNRVIFLQVTRNIEYDIFLLPVNRLIYL